MKLRSLPWAALALVALSAAPSAQKQSGAFPAADVDDLAQTEARSFEELRGRLLLVEFFAYW